VAEKGGRTEVSEIGSAGAEGVKSLATVWEKTVGLTIRRGRKERLTLDYTPGCSVWRGAKSNANWHRRKEDRAQR
jgi:hypothetical protein